MIIALKEITENEVCAGKLKKETCPVFKKEGNIDF